MAVFAMSDDGEGSWSAADEATNADGRVGASATKFFAVVDEFYLTAVVGHDYDAVEVLSEGVDLVIFCFVIAEGFDEGAEVPVGFVACVFCI